MAATPFDPADVLTPITDTLTSGPALLAYGSVAALGVAIGTGVKLGPRLWSYAWKFIGR